MFRRLSTLGAAAPDFVFRLGPIVTLGGASRHNTHTLGAADADSTAYSVRSTSSSVGKRTTNRGGTPEFLGATASSEPGSFGILTGFDLFSPPQRPFLKLPSQVSWSAREDSQVLVLVLALVDGEIPAGP